MSMSKNWKVIKEKNINLKAVVIIGVTLYEHTPVVENNLLIAAGEWMLENNNRFNSSFVKFSKTRSGEATVIVVFGMWRVKCNKCKIKKESSARLTDCVRHGCEGVMSA